MCLFMCMWSVSILRRNSYGRCTCVVCMRLCVFVFFLRPFPVAKLNSPAMIYVCVLCVCIAFLPILLAFLRSCPSLVCSICGCVMCICTQICFFGYMYVLSLCSVVLRMCICVLFFCMYVCCACFHVSAYGFCSRCMRPAPVVVYLYVYVYPYVLCACIVWWCCVLFMCVLFTFICMSMCRCVLFVYVFS